MSKASVRSFPLWRTRVTATAIVAVTMMVVSGCGSSAVSIPSPIPPTPTSTPVLGVATPGPQAQFVHDLAICAALDANLRCPGGSIGQIPKQSTLNAVWTVAGFPVGEKHTITYSWLVNDNPLAMKTLPVQGNLNYSIRTYIPAGTGIGKLKLYWDAPASDGSTLPSDDFLAQSIAFLIQ